MNNRRSAPYCKNPPPYCNSSMGGVWTWCVCVQAGEGSRRSSWEQTVCFMSLVSKSREGLIKSGSPSLPDEFFIKTVCSPWAPTKISYKSSINWGLMISMRWSFAAKSSHCTAGWSPSRERAHGNTGKEHPPVNNKGKSDTAQGFRCSKGELTPLGHAGPSWVGEWNLLFNKLLLESTLLPKCWRSGTNRELQRRYMSQWWAVS